MEIHQARYFLMVCETLNFTRAAERCHVAQPSLTRAIKKLEEEFGGRLFSRERKNTHLTQLGRRVRPHIEQVMEAIETAQTEAESFRSAASPSLRLGVMCTIGPVRLVPFFEELRRTIPGLALTLKEAPGHALVDEMMAGELEIALIGLPHIPERLAAIPLYDERYVVAFPPGHRFEGQTTVASRDLDGEAYLQRSNCEFSDHFDEHGIERAFKVDTIYRSEREEWIQAMIAAGAGCSLMPEFTPMLPGLATRVLVEPEVSRTIKLVTVSGRRHSPTVAAAVRVVRRFPWPGMTAPGQAA
ncbi:LysR family transcriptional regulator [Oceanibacterium hippocampi]|uniref:Hydrogen peroxide-inducible genes activator n=1 Tax=Oceanibacterium hippocampi TaxID=745714 RepID=A0A1Y5S470_9PROT|nr:LysR family transcriptional regulator [Oceanibacterium hippocampi]SLN32257.1 Hydrogen peroxide-inducible genes activator [Oceanibacterium hippocampi]